MAVVLVATDTEAGKTTLAALLLAAFPERLAYWKPIQTGPPDSDAVQRLVPEAQVLPALVSLEEPVAPLLAARRSGRTVPSPSAIAAAVPTVGSRTLLIETFGSPLSPLTAETLQVDYLKLLPAHRLVLVTPSRVGAVGRALQAYYALEAHGLLPRALVLLGEHDAFAEETLKHHLPACRVLSIRPPSAWHPAAVAEAAAAQRGTLAALLELPLAPYPLPCTPSRTSQPSTKPRTAVTASDQQHIWHPFSPLAGPAALEVVAAEDEYLVLADGRRVIDAIGSWWTILHGHRFPPLVAAAAAALHRLDHVHFAGLTHAPAASVAEKLLQTMNWPPGGRVFFSDDGSTAVEVALKLSVQYWRIRGQPQRRVFVGFEGAYHGDTLGAMAVSRDRLFCGPFEPLLTEARIVPLDASALQTLLEQQADRLAAVILEPLVQGAGGMRIYPPELLRQLVTLAQKAGVLVIVDEVLTGCCRTGRFWAHQHAGVTPDLVCTAKALAGGLFPLAATLAAPWVVEAFLGDDPQRVFYHGHTFTAHPIACAVAEENLRLIEAHGAERVARLERFFRNRLRKLTRRPGVRDVRVLGNIAAVEVDLPGGYLADTRRTVVRVGLERGVLLRPLGAVLYTIPPWCTSDASLEAIADAIEACVDALFG